MYTLRSIRDADGPTVAEKVYSQLFQGSSFDISAVSGALHLAICKLREGEDVDLMHWVPFIHVGL